MKRTAYLGIALILSLGVVLGSVKYGMVSIHAQSSTSVSIVNGASSPSISKPYNPSPLTVKPGTSVTWTNNDSTIHTVTSGLPEQGEVGTLFDSSIMSPGKTFTHIFDKTGIFDYSCTLHPFMHGQIISK
ncbi:MAG TPA: plastocyanin/azurin family copper-binding protein [Nitrososphaeraceae archaeon]|jgi:plastocyanin